MSPITKLVAVVMLVVGSAAWLAYVGGSASWQYYVTLDECVRDSTLFLGKRIRVNGTVAPESLKIAADRQTATFELSGTTERIHVICAGPLPDNLQEAMDVVVEGTLQSATHMQGNKVLTRCASKYERQRE